MFNQKDLYAALQNGENPEKIAQQFADALNGAIAQKKKEEAEAEAAKKAAEAQTKARIEAIEDILDYIADFVEEFYPDMYNPDMFEDVDAAEIDKLIMQAYKETIAMVAPLKEMMRQHKAEQAKPVLKMATTVAPQDADAALKAFLTRNGF